MIIKGYKINISLDPNNENEGNFIIESADNLPILDPNSPEFDAALYEEITTEAKRELSAQLKDFGAKATQAITATADFGTKLYNAISNILSSDPLKQLQETFKYIADHYEEWSQKVAEWDAISPYLEAELKKPEYEGKTLNELLDEQATSEDGKSLLDIAIANAKAARAAKELLPKISITEKGAKSLEYPLDKINANVWGLLVAADSTGQLTFKAEKKGSKKEANIIYGINFDDLPAELVITKHLTAFDKRVYIAAGALFNNSFEIITPAQIYTTMGNTGRPSAADIKKINDSITKMAAANIYINNTSEHNLYKNYAKFVYDAKLLPMERITAVVNGQTVDSAIHLFREPPLISFAKARKQITTIKRELLESPLSKTDANLQIDDYLIERIAHIKKSRGKINNKLLYSTIFDNAGITTKMQRKRAKEKISKYLEHYKKCGFIKDYTESEDGVTITY